MTRTTTLRLLAGGAATALLLATPSAASAAGSSASTTPARGAASAAAVAYCHGRADAEIARRLTTLAADLTLVNGATHLAAPDQQTLASLIASDEAGLGALKTTVDATTDVASCHSDAMNIVTAYRVYVLVGPKIHLTVAAGRVQAAGAIFTDLSTKLQTAVNAAKAKGRNVAGAQAALDRTNSQVAAALAAAGLVPGQVLALDPAGYPTNQTVLTSARQSLQTARQDLRSARADAAQVVAQLR